MSKAKPTVVQVEFFIENEQWAAKGPKVRVQAATLMAIRRRTRKAVDAAYGPGAEIQAVLRIPDALQYAVERNKEHRFRLRAERVKLRDDTVELVNTLRHQLGTSYDDAAELLGVDAAVLMRTVHNTTRLTFAKGDDESEEQ